MRLGNGAHIDKKGQTMKRTIIRFLTNGYTATRKYTLDELSRAFYPLKHIAQKRPDGNIWLTSNNFWQDSNNANRIELIADLSACRLGDIKDGGYFHILNRFENGDGYGIART